MHDTEEAPGEQMLNVMPLTEEDIAAQNPDAVNGHQLAVGYNVREALNSTDAVGTAQEEIKTPSQETHSEGVVNRVMDDVEDRIDAVVSNPRVEGAQEALRGTDLWYNPVKGAKMVQNGVDKMIHGEDSSEDPTSAVPEDMPLNPPKTVPGM